MVLTPIYFIFLTIVIKVLFSISGNLTRISVYSPSIDPLVGAKLTPYLKWDTKLNFYSETFAFQIKIEAFCKYSVKYCISNSWFVYKRVPMFYWEL
jgi:hypothetical protein